jgi:hypothetical protein
LFRAAISGQIDIQHPYVKFGASILGAPIFTVDVFTNKTKIVKALSCLHNISPIATKLSCNIDQGGSQHVDEEVYGWGR